MCRVDLMRQTGRGGELQAISRKIVERNSFPRTTFRLLELPSSRVFLNKKNDKATLQTHSAIYSLLYNKYIAVIFHFSFLYTENLELELGLVNILSYSVGNGSTFFGSKAAGALS